MHLPLLTPVRMPDSYQTGLGAVVIKNDRYIAGVSVTDMLVGRERRISIARGMQVGSLFRDKAELEIWRDALVGFAK